MNLPRWFRQAWPYDRQRAAVIAEYGRLAAMPLVLADIGLRGAVWDAAPPAKDLYSAGVQEGRRQMALEIFRIVKADPRLLFGHVPAKQLNQEPRT